MKSKKLLSGLLVVVMLLGMMPIMSVSAAEISTSFTADWTDGGDTAWAINSTSDGFTETGIKTGIDALVLTGNANATENSIGAEYRCGDANAVPLAMEFDFEVTEGSYFRVRANDGRNGFWVGHDGSLGFIDMGDWEKPPTNGAIKVAPDTVHTMRMEMIDEARAGNHGTSSVPMGLKYYLDGQLVYSSSTCVVGAQYYLCVGKNSVAKIYEIRLSGADSWMNKYAIVQRFTGKTVDSINAEFNSEDARGMLTGVGNSDANVTAEVVRQSDSTYLRVERINGKFDWTVNSGENASLFYTTPSTGNTEEYNLDIVFAYRGLGSSEMRFQGANDDVWFTQMKIDDGRLYVSTNGSNNWGSALTDWLEPYKEHTLTLSVKAGEGDGTLFAISVDGEVVARDVSTINSGFSLNYPAILKFYSMAQTVNTGSAETNPDLYNGMFIKSITTEEYSIPEEPDVPDVPDTPGVSTGWELNNGTNVTTGVEAGQSALVIKTGDTAPSDVYAAEFAVDYGANAESVYEIDFAIKEGTQFGVMADEEAGATDGKRHFWAEVGTDGVLGVAEGDTYKGETNTGITVKPGVVHTLKMACYSNDYGNKTEYYFDGTKVGETTKEANPKWIRFRVGGENAEAKIYRLAKSISNNPTSDHQYRYFCETFDDVADVAALEAKNISDKDDGWAITKYNNGHTVTIEKDNASTEYIKMRRTGSGSDNGSLVYTMPSGNTTPADLNITFMYDGAGQNEFRFTSADGNQWMCRMFTQDGGLYWGTSKEDYTGDLLKDWIAPFTEHTLTLRVGDGNIKIFLDDEYLDVKTPFSSGFGSGLPGILRFYSLSKTITDTKNAQKYLFTGLAIKSVTVDNNTYAPTLVSARWEMNESEDVTTEVANGKSALVIRTGDTAPTAAPAIDFALNYATNGQSIYEVDFSVNETARLDIEAFRSKLNEPDDTKVFWAEADNCMVSVSKGDLKNGMSTIPNVDKTPGIVHTLKLVCYSEGFGNKTEYYLDGIYGGETTIAANPKWLRFSVPEANSEVKIYRIAKSVANNPGGDDMDKRYYCETFDDVNSIAELEAKSFSDYTANGRGDGWFISNYNNGHTITIEKENTSTRYLTMRRSSVGKGDGSLVYTTVKKKSVPADINLSFMYDGAGKTEFYATDEDCNKYLARMYVEDGKLYWCTSADGTTAEVIKDWIAPFTDYTLILRTGEGATVKIFLNDELIGEKTPLSNSFAGNAPSRFTFYTKAESLESDSIAQKGMFAGFAVKSVAVEPFAKTDYTPYGEDGEVSQNGVWTTRGTEPYVEIGKKQGIDALVLTGSANATIDSVGAVYACGVANGAPVVLEFDFEIEKSNMTTGFAVFGDDTSTGFAVANEELKFFDNKNLNNAMWSLEGGKAPIEDGVVHTMRIEMTDGARAEANGVSQGTNYYIDGKHIYSTKNCVVANNYYLTVVGNTKAKIYEIRRYGVNVYTEPFAQVERFTGKTAASINADTTDRLSGVGTSNANVTAEVQNQSSTTYIGMERLSGPYKTDLQTDNAEIKYALGDTHNANKYDLRIKFAYKGMGPTEFRITDKNNEDMWFSQMKIDDGKLYISLDGAYNWGKAISGWIEPFKEHTLTLTVKNKTAEDGAVYTVKLDGKVLAVDVPTTNSGFGFNYPGNIHFYSIGQTANTSENKTNLDMMNGVFVSMIETTAYELLDTENAPLSLVGADDRPINQFSPTDEEKTIKALVNLTNTSEDDIKARVILAKYSNNGTKLEEIFVGDEIFVPALAIIEEAMVTFVLDGMEAGATYKVFLIDGFGKLAPVVENIVKIVE